MAAVRIFDRIRRRRGFLPRPRVLRDRGNLVEGLEKEEIYNRYRFRPHTILFTTFLNKTQTGTIPFLLSAQTCLHCPHH